MQYRHQHTETYQTLSKCFKKRNKDMQLFRIILYRFQRETNFIFVLEMQMDILGCIDHIFILCSNDIWAFSAHFIWYWFISYCILKWYAGYPCFKYIFFQSRSLSSEAFLKFLPLIKFNSKCIIPLISLYASPLPRAREGRSHHCVTCLVKGIFESGSTGICFGSFSEFYSSAHISHTLASCGSFDERIPVGKW